MSFLQSHLLTGVDKPVIIHWHNALSLGGSEKMCQLHLKYFKQLDDPFQHMVGYRSQGDNEREIYFRDIVGQENMICVDNDAEFVARVAEIKPFIVHRYAAGIPEFPLVPRIKENTQHFTFQQSHRGMIKSIHNSEDHSRLRRNTNIFGMNPNMK